MGHRFEADLGRLDAHYKATLTDADRERGLIGQVGAPPTDGDYMVTELWKRHLRPEALEDRDVTEGMSAEAQAKLVAELTAFTKGGAVPALSRSFGR